MKNYILTQFDSYNYFTSILGVFSTREKAEEGLSIINPSQIPGDGNLNLNKHFKYYIEEYEVDYIPDHPNQGMFWMIEYEKSSRKFRFLTFMNPWDYPNGTFSIETSIESENADYYTITCWAKTEEEAKLKVLSVLNTRSS